MIEPADEDPIEPLEPATVQLSSEIPADIEFAIPAPAYSSIATESAFEGPESLSLTQPPIQTLDLSAALDALAALHRKLDSLGAAFDREVRAEATREKIVDRLHAELQEYKQDLVLTVMKPVFLDLIQLHDDVGKMMAAGENEESSLSTSLSDVRQAVEDILYRQGVEPFQGDGNDFDARRQRAITTVPTDDSNLARKIATRLRTGFAAGERVIRPEIVSVFAVRRG